MTFFFPFKLVLALKAEDILTELKSPGGKKKSSPLNHCFSHHVTLLFQDLQGKKKKYGWIYKELCSKLD